MFKSIVNTAIGLKTDPVINISTHLSVCCHQRSSIIHYSCSRIIHQDLEHYRLVLSSNFLSGVQSHASYYIHNDSS